MSTQQDPYAKGNWIVHANYGVGQIKGREKKVLNGEKQTFLRVKTFNGVYWLPVENKDVDHIRPISSKNKIGRALTLIRKPPKKLPKDHKRRGKKIYQGLRDVSLYSKARIIRDLHGRKVSSRLNQSEEDIFKKITKQFLNEWSIVCDEDSEILIEKLEEALQTSIEKKEKPREEKETWLEKAINEVRGKKETKNSK